MVRSPSSTHATNIITSIGPSERRRLARFVKTGNYALKAGDRPDARCRCAGIPAPRALAVCAARQSESGLAVWVGSGLAFPISRAVAQPVKVRYRDRCQPHIRRWINPQHPELPLSGSSCVRIRVSGRRRRPGLAAGSHGHTGNHSSAGSGLRYRRLRIGSVYAAQDVAVRRDLRPKDFRLFAVQRENLAHQIAYRLITLLIKHQN